jgi:hypothetical protein
LFGAFRRHGHGGKVLAEHPRGRGFGKREELLPFRVGLASGQRTSCKRKLLFVVVGEDVVWRKGEVSESRGYCGVGMRQYGVAPKAQCLKSDQTAMKRNQETTIIKNVNGINDLLNEVLSNRLLEPANL